MADGLRSNPHVVGVEGARPYGVAGNLPSDAVVSARNVNGQGNAVRYVSDAPYLPAYADRPTCVGMKKNGEPCRGKARPEGSCCTSHVDQE